MNLSCSNDDHDIDDQVLGNWEWIQSSGGIAGTTETPDSTGNSIMLEITRTAIKQFINGTLSFETGYSIKSQESTIFGGIRNMIIYENGFKQSFERVGNKLFLSGECNDCFLSEYEKVL